MAGGGGPSIGSGRRKSLDAEINLVPFIDLLSMCICFLLMTAIWVELSSIPIKQILGTEAAASTGKSLDLQIRVQQDKSLAVQLEKNGQVVQKMVLNAGKYDLTLASLSNYVSQVMQNIPANADGSAPDITARVIPSYLNYAEMIQVLDVVRGYGISRLAIVPTKE
jgi:biopolymer transport protein TolR